MAPHVDPLWKESLLGAAGVAVTLSLQRSSESFQILSWCVLSAVESLHAVLDASSFTARLYNPIVSGNGLLGVAIWSSRDTHRNVARFMCVIRFCSASIHQADAELQCLKRSTHAEANTVCLWISLFGSRRRLTTETDTTAKFDPSCSHCESPCHVERFWAKPSCTDSSEQSLGATS